MKLFFDNEIRDFIIKSAYTSPLADEFERQVYANLLELFLDEFGFLSYLESFEITNSNYRYFSDTFKKHFDVNSLDELKKHQFFS